MAYQGLNYAYEALNVFFLLTYTPINIYLYKQHKLKYDRITVLLVLLFQLVYIIRAINGLLYILDYQELVTALFVDVTQSCGLFEQICLYILISEMIKLMIKINPKYFQNQKEMQQKTGKILRVILILILISYSVITFCNFYESLTRQGSNRKYFDNFYTLINFIARTLRMIGDFVIFFAFIYTFMYFVNEKRSVLRKRNQTLSNLNRFIIVWTIFVAVLNILRNLLNYIGEMIEYSTLYDNETLTYIDRVNSRVIRQIADGLAGLSFLYLCYFLGNDRSAKQGRQPRHSANETTTHSDSIEIKRILNQGSNDNEIRSESINQNLRSYEEIQTMENQSSGEQSNHYSQESSTQLQEMIMNQLYNDSYIPEIYPL